LVSLSPYYFARVLEKAVGLPPHAYLESVRITKACELLDKGATIGTTAFSAGYADQSHLTKRFKRILAILQDNTVKRTKKPAFVRSNFQKSEIEQESTRLIGAKRRQSSYELLDRIPGVKRREPGNVFAPLPQ
jgi:AraC-like DNA-binding protein